MTSMDSHDEQSKDENRGQNVNVDPLFYLIPLAGKSEDSQMLLAFIVKSSQNVIAYYSNGRDPSPWLPSSLLGLLCVLGLYERWQPGQIR